jgi:hypothetical protein
MRRSLGNWLTSATRFFVGNVDSNSIKIKKPKYHNDQASGGSNYVQWLNPGTVTATATTTTNSDGSTTTTCTYSGTGFVTNPACQPTGYNLRVFPTRVNGVRQMGMNGAAVSVQRTFPIIERMSLETTFNAYNLFNHQVLGGVNANRQIQTSGESSAMVGQTPLVDGYPSRGACGSEINH